MKLSALVRAAAAAVALIHVADGLHMASESLPSAAARVREKLCRSPANPTEHQSPWSTAPCVGRRRTVVPVANTLHVPLPRLPMIGVGSTSPDALLPSILLVAGNMIGAGVLALPSVSLPAGFGPSVCAIGASWLAMVSTGLLIAEVMLNCQRVGKGQADPAAAAPGEVSIMGMAQSTLGDLAGFGACVTFVMLNTALLVAYISKGAEVLDVAASLVLPGEVHVPPEAWMLGFAACIWAAGAVGPSDAFDRLNSSLMLLLFVAFGMMMQSLLPHVDPSLLHHADLAALPHAVPVFVCALVYQNCVPTIVGRLDGDTGAIRTCIVAGTALPVLLYVLFNVAFLGTLDTSLESSGVSTAELATSIGKAMGSSPLALATLPMFSLCAVVTSSLGTVISQVEELKALWLNPVTRAVDVETGDQYKAPAVAGAAVAAPLAISLTCPGMFERALEFGGLYGDLVLFGLMPAAMAWNQREQLATNAAFEPVRMLQGGRAPLFALGASAGGFIAVKALSGLIEAVADVTLL